MSRKVVKKTKSSRVSATSTKRVNRIKAKGFNSTLLLIPLLVVVALGSFFILMQVNNKAYAATGITPKDCINESSYSNSNVSTFVNADQKGTSSKLTAYLECGTGPAWTRTVYRFFITTNKHKLQVALDHYMDAQPPSSFTHPSATLKIVNSNTAIFNCSNGKYVFNLYKSQ